MRLAGRVDRVAARLARLGIEVQDVVMPTVDEPWDVPKQVQEPLAEFVAASEAHAAVYGRRLVDGAMWPMDPEPGDPVALEAAKDDAWDRLLRAVHEHGGLAAFAELAHHHVDPEGAAPAGWEAHRPRSAPDGSRR